MLEGAEFQGEGNLSLRNPFLGMSLVILNENW